MSSNSRECLEIDNQINGVIRGKILDVEGQPAGPVVEVSIIQADAETEKPSSSVRCSEKTEDDGTYEFNGLLPGDYIICTKPRRSPGTHLSTTETYYPSTSSMDEAQILHLGEGEKKSNIDIRLLPSGP